MKLARRTFIKSALSGGVLGILGRGGVLASLGAINAKAAVNSGYKALVCLFLNGGHDSHNLIVPVDASGNLSDAYTAVRPAGGQLSMETYGTPLSLGNGYAVSPNFTNLQRLFQSKQAAIVANVGPLKTSGSLDPKSLNKSNFGPSALSVLPDAAYSHFDQQNQWQAATASNTAIGTGWGGRLGDTGIGSGVTLTLPSGPWQTTCQQPLGTFPTTFNAGSAGLFNVGASSTPTYAGGPGAAAAQVLDYDLGASSLLNFDAGVLLMQAGNQSTCSGQAQGQALAAALASLTNDFSSVFERTKGEIPPLSAQLQLVAQVISVSAMLGVNRQVFFVSLGGFDTHSSEDATLLRANTSGFIGGLQYQLDLGIGSFMQAVSSISGLSSNQVTLFTASEFGRTLQPNGDGCDHGWGGHHIVVGGAVAGGTIYGAFPDISVGGSQDATTLPGMTPRGILIPTTSVEQYSAELASWFGVPATSLSNIFPNLANFATVNQNLSFMKV